MRLSPLSPKAEWRATKLKEWRRMKAREKNVAAYRILTNRSVRELALLRPSTLKALNDIHGIGPRKVSEFGEELVVLLASLEEKAASSSI